MSIQLQKDVLVASRCQWLQIKLLQRSVCQAGADTRFQIGCIDTYGWGHQAAAEFYETASQSRRPPPSGCRGPRESLLQRPLPSLHSQGPWWLSESGPLIARAPTPPPEGLAAGGREAEHPHQPPPAPLGPPPVLPGSLESGRRPAELLALPAGTRASSGGAPPQTSGAGVPLLELKVGQHLLPGCFSRTMGLHIASGLGSAPRLHGLYPAAVPRPQREAEAPGGKTLYPPRSS